MICKRLGLRSGGRWSILAFLLVVMTTVPAKALDIREWIDPLGGDYVDPNNWLGGDVANTITDFAFFNLSNTYDVTLTSGETVSIFRLWVSGDDVTFNASGAASAILDMDEDALLNGNVTLMSDVILNVDLRIEIKNGSTVSLLEGSGVTANRLDLSYISSSSSSMIVDGDSSLAVSTLSLIGGGGVGVGTLTFQNGSTGNSLGGSVELMANRVEAGSTGRMNVLSGSTLQTGNIIVGRSTSANDAQEGTLTVDDVGSMLTMTGASTLTVGDDVNPNVVSDVIVSNAAVMNSGTGAILIQNSGHLDVQAGTFHANGNLILDGGTITVNDGAVNTNASLDISGTLNVEAGGQVISSGTNIGEEIGSIGEATVTGLGSTWDAGQLTIGNNGQGTLNVEAEGQMFSSDTIIGRELGSIGEATVTGPGSTWNMGYSNIGGHGQGTLNVEAGGQVLSVAASIGALSDSDGAATVTGPDSIWTVSSSFHVGLLGDGILDIEAGGQLVTFGQSFIAVDNSSIGTATVTGTGSTWTTDELIIGAGSGGQGSLNIGQSGLVTLTGSINIGFQSSVTLSTGGRLEFGTIDATSYGRISGTSGELAGDYPLSGFNALSAIDLSITNLDTSEVRILNSGEIYGSGVVSQALANTAAGELRTFVGEWARFNGIGNTNAGEINNFAGAVEFVQGITNETTGFVSGRGQFIAAGGWTNEGVMAFSGGPADVLGDFVNSAGGQIVTTGGAVTTFYDDVVHNGIEIRTADGSSTVIFGAASGAGPYTGTGTVFFEGDLRPSNSPGVVDFEGDVVLGSLLTSEFELSGTDSGLYDQLNVVNTITLDGTLDVSLLNGYIPDAGDTFEIIQAASIIGAFDTINLPTLPSDLHWFVNQTATSLELVSTYAADFDEDGDVDNDDLAAWEGGFGNSPAVHMTGDANADTFASGIDFLTWQRQFGMAGAVAAASAVPEPSSLLLVALGLLTLSAKRKRV